MLLLKASFTKHCVCMLSIAASLLLSCSSPASTATPTPIPALPLPGWLAMVFPKPGEQLSLHEYNAHGEPFYSGGAVCLEVDAVPLLEEGDYWDEEDLKKRTTVTVDGKKVEKIIGGWNLKGLDSLVRQDDQGNWVVTVASTVTQSTWCFAAPLSDGFFHTLATGVHQVNVQFERSNGERVSFTWMFELTSGP